MIVPPRDLEVVLFALEEPLFYLLRRLIEALSLRTVSS